MKFNNSLYEIEELTYEDVFIFQDDVSILPSSGFLNSSASKLGATLPMISANMNAVTWKRMAETLARYGWLGVLPQDMNIDKMLEIISFVKTRHIKFDTPLTVSKSNNVRDALWIINKRAHKCVILIDDQNKPISIFTPSDLEKYEQFTLLWNINKNFLITASESISPEEAYNEMNKHWISSLPIISSQGTLIWILTKKDAVRQGLLSPSLDSSWKLNLIVALWINSFLDKAKILIDAGINIFILDTAHWYQKTMIDSIKSFRKAFWKDIVLIAGNVSTENWTRDLLLAWADGVKVWIWPWAMCTTRIMTGVGRPQFSAVYHCSKIARELGWFVIADWWIKEPRDMCLALAAGASFIMLWTILSWTFESTWDIFFDSDGLMYKQNYGMASWKAVFLRNEILSPFKQAQKALFQEGISTSKIYLKEGYKSVGDIVDKFCSWLRSSMTYVWASNLNDFHKNVIIWVQTPSWYKEWTPHWQLKK